MKTHLSKVTSRTRSAATRALMSARIRARWAAAKAVGRNRLKPNGAAAAAVDTRGNNGIGAEGRPVRIAKSIGLLPAEWAELDKLCAGYPWHGNRSAWIRDQVNKATHRRHGKGA